MYKIGDKVRVDGYVLDQEIVRIYKCKDGVQYSTMNEDGLMFNLEDNMILKLVTPINDTINHPEHYTKGSIECIEFIEDQELPYHLGNAVKYIVRARFKSDEEEDINKAIWYLNRYLTQKKLMNPMQKIEAIDNINKLLESDIDELENTIKEMQSIIDTLEVEE